MYLCLYKIIPCSRNGVDLGGVIEVIQGAVALDKIKMPLKPYFVRKFGDVNSDTFRNAQIAFVNSLAGYSVLSYLLALKVSWKDF